MEEKQIQILPNSIEEYEKETKPRFDESCNETKCQAKLDTSIVNYPKNERFYILKFIFTVLDFIRIRFYKLRFKISDGCADIKFYAIDHEHMKEFTLQNLIFRSFLLSDVYYLNNNVSYKYAKPKPVVSGDYFHKNSMMFSMSDINTLFYFEGMSRYISIGTGDKYLISFKNSEFWISQDYGITWEKSKKKIFEVYKKLINKTEVEDHYFDRFKSILNLFKSEKELYLIGFLNVVILCDRKTYDYILDKSNHLWCL